VTASSSRGDTFIVKNGDQNGGRTHRFADIVVELDRYNLVKGGESKKITPRAFEVLNYLIEHRERVVEKQELFEQIWGESFVSDNALTRAIREIRQVIGDDADAPRYIETVPKRGYRFIAEISDAPSENVVPLDIVLAERTEEPSIGRGLRLNRKVAVVAIGFVSIAVALVLTSWWMSRKTVQRVTGMPRTIAVLPFKPVVADNRDPAFELGMADNLITRLSNLRQIIIRPTGAIRKYSSLDQDPIAAGRELGVEAVLEASMHRMGEKVRVNARLLDTKDGSAIWSYQSDNYFTDIFTAQTTISEKIASALALELAGRELQLLARRHTNKSEAYQLYAKGRYHLFRRTGRDTEKAIGYFRQAVTSDSNYALAHEGLAFAYISLCYLGVVPCIEVMPKAKESVMRALEIDSSLAEAHTTFGLFKFTYYWDWSGAERYLKAALALNPNSSYVHQIYAFYLSNVGRSNEAIAEINKALELDPTSLFANRFLGMFLYFARQPDRAIDQLQKTFDLDSTFETTYGWMANSYEQIGDYEKSVIWDMKLEKAPQSVKALTETYAASGWNGYWRKRIDLTQENANRSYIDPYHLATMHARLGEKEQALKHLHKAFDERSSQLVFLKIDPTLDNLRSDPRFPALLRRIGLSGQQ
jgi:DNA-binding winged helix-turn-helix (wHTH) protein/TolB-like protein